jgi:hypothetical protein
MTTTNTDHLTSESSRELERVLERLDAGIRDPEEGRRALERLARESEEIRQRLGTLDVVVDLVREARDP